MGLTLTTALGGLPKKPSATVPICIVAPGSADDGFNRFL